MKRLPSLASVTFCLFLLPSWLPRRAAIWEKSNRPEVKVESASDQVIALEKRAWETLKIHDKTAHENLLANDFRIMNRKGILTKAQFLEEFDRIQVQRYELQNLDAQPLSTDSFVVTYRAKGTIAFDEASQDFDSYRSSIWVKRGDHWVNVFYQASEAR